LTNTKKEWKRGGMINKEDYEERRRQNAIKTKDKQKTSVFICVLINEVAWRVLSLSRNGVGGIRHF